MVDHIEKPTIQARLNTTRNKSKVKFHETGSIERSNDKNLKEKGDLFQLGNGIGKVGGGEIDAIEMRDVDERWM